MARGKKAAPPPSLVLERAPHRADGRRRARRRSPGLLDSFSAWRASLLSLEHGGDIRVPPAWRSEPRLSRTSLYALSSLTYSCVGLLIFGLLSLRPGAALHPTLEHAEAALFVWQGLISYQCDAIDLGIPSWSHPVDRLSATAFTLLLAAKHALFVRCAGEWGRLLHAAFWAVGAVGGVCFSRSCEACRAQRLEAYAFWHVAWHLAFPLAISGFYLAQFLATESVQCALATL